MTRHALDLKGGPLADSLSRFVLLQPDGARFLLGQWLQLLSKEDLYCLSSAYERIMYANADPDDPFFQELSLVSMLAHSMETNMDELDVTITEIVDLIRKLSMAATLQCLNREGAVLFPSAPLSINPDIQDDIRFEPCVLRERQKQFQEIPGFELFVAPVLESTFNPSATATRH